MDFSRFRPAWFHRDRLSKTGQVMLLAQRAFFKDNGPIWAAAIAYYSLLSVFPLLLAIGSVASYFGDRQWAIYQAIGYLGDFLPRGPHAIEQVVREALEGGRGGGLLFFGALLWSGSLVFNAMIKALNIAYDEEDEYGFLKRIFLRFGILVTVGAMFLAALAAPLVLRVLRVTLGILPAGSEAIFNLITSALPVVFVMLAFFLAYRFIPKRGPNWRAALFGAGTATLMFAAAKPLFFGYLQERTQYKLVYGSLTGIIVVVLWTWIVAMIGLFGAQISAHSQAVLIEEQPIHKVERRHVSGRKRFLRQRSRRF